MHVCGVPMPQESSRGAANDQQPGGPSLWVYYIMLYIWVYYIIYPVGVWDTVVIMGRRVRVQVLCVSFHVCVCVRMYYVCNVCMYVCM